MDISLNKKGINSEDIISKICKGTHLPKLNVVRQKHISGDIKAVGKYMVESVACYGFEVWPFKREEQKTISSRNGLCKEAS